MVLNQNIVHFTQGHFKYISSCTVITHVATFVCSVYIDGPFWECYEGSKVKQRRGNLHYSMAGHYIDASTTHPSSLQRIGIEKSHQQPTSLTRSVD